MNKSYNEKRAKLHRGLIRYHKIILRKFKNKHSNTMPIFIMGCGRSGTSMMVRTFEYDHRIETLGEHNPLIQKNHMLLKDNIESVIDHCKAPIIVMKPILNSFEAYSFLERYELLKIIWMLRDYKDMAASSVIKFGSVVSDYMKELVQNRRGKNWLANGMPDETLKILENMDTSNFNLYDWMCLVWWSVNRTIIIDRLYQHERFFLIRYEKIASDPFSVLDPLYKWIKLSNNTKISKCIHPLSIGKGSDIFVQPIIRNMCEQLTEELNSVI